MELGSKLDSDEAIIDCVTEKYKKGRRWRDIRCQEFRHILFAEILQTLF